MREIAFLIRHNWYLVSHIMNLVSVTRVSSNVQGKMILMHGLGSDEQDMFSLAEQIDPRVEVICLRAPHIYGPGYAWFDVQWTAQGIVADPVQVKASVTGVVEYLQSINAGKLIIGGFSQGAMMALGILYKCPEICVSGVSRTYFSGSRVI
jgi:predicted esterase